MLDGVTEISCYLNKLNLYFKMHNVLDLYANYIIVIFFYNNLIICICVISS